MHFFPYIQVREEKHSSGVVHPGHRARLCQRIRQFLHSVFGSAVLHRLLSDRNQPHLHRVMQVEDDFTTKTISKRYNSDLFCSDSRRCWMGRHASSLVYGCDRQPVLVFRQHAAGCICLPGQWLADAHPHSYKPTWTCNINMVVRETKLTICTLLETAGTSTRI